MGQGNGHNAIDSLIFMNELQQFALPSTTAVAQPPFLPDKGNLPSSEDFAKNQTQNLANLVGSIGSPQGLSNEELLEMVMSTSPVGASIRGGKVAKSTMQQLQDLAAKYAPKTIKGRPFSRVGGRWGDHENKMYRMQEVAEKKLINWNNKINAARIQNLKILQGKGSTGKVGKFKEDPDKQGMVDPVSALLNYFSKN